MKNKHGRFKYRCDECGSEAFYDRKEFDRASRPRCTGCGSTRLDPVSKLAQDTWSTGVDMARVRQAENDRKMNK